MLGVFFIGCVCVCVWGGGGGGGGRGLSSECCVMLCNQSEGDLGECFPGSFDALSVSIF